MNKKDYYHEKISKKYIHRDIEYVIFVWIDGLCEQNKT